MLWSNAHRFFYDRMRFLAWPNRCIGYNIIPDVYLLFLHPSELERSFRVYSSDLVFKIILNMFGILRSWFLFLFKIMHTFWGVSDISAKTKSLIWRRWILLVVRGKTLPVVIIGARHCRVYSTSCCCRCCVRNKTKWFWDTFDPVNILSSLKI